MGQSDHWKELFSAIQEEEWDDAITSIDSLIRKEPADPEHFIKLGDLHVNSNNRKDALFAFRNALRLYKQNHETSRAIVACKKILSVDPGCQDIAEELEALLEEHEKSGAIAIRLDEAGLTQPGTEPGPVSSGGPVARLRALIASEKAPELLKLLFSDIEDSLLSELESRTCNAGDVIIREGEAGESIFILMSGGVEVSVEVQGKRVPLAVLMDGDVFGEMAFLTSRRRTATVTAMTCLDIIELKKSLLDAVMEKKPYLLRYLYNVYITRMETTIDEFRKTAGGSLSGSLRELPLPEILQVLEQTRKEGVLVIKAEGVSGSISFSPGQIEDAECNMVRGEDAIMALLSLHDGTFRYEPKKVATGKMSQPIRYVLMEAIRKIDEKAAGLR